MAVAGINFLALKAGTWFGLSPTSVQPFRISGFGTVSNWFSSLLFLATTLASLQIYAMRRHRCDDYNGHYQIWLWMAGLFALVSCNHAVDMRGLFADVVRWTGLSGGNNLVVLLMAKLVALTALVVRGIMEIRASRAALVAVILVWLTYGSAILLQIPAAQNQFVANNDFLRGDLNLLGHVSLFLAAIFYNRFVYLHANKLVAAITTKRPKQSAKVNGAAKQITSRERPENAKIGKRDAELSSEPSQDHNSREQPVLPIQPPTSDSKPLSAGGKKSRNKQRRAA
jgi:uncharacterized membrane protein YbhN (UPF0104 family)